MKIKNIAIAIFVLLGFLSTATISQAFDDVFTHPMITDAAIKKSTLTGYLSNNLGAQFSKDYDTLIQGMKVKDWLKRGSTLEDSPMCRAANHFHNPLLPWNQSYMTDEPGWLDVYCWDWKPIYSNITWATGYLALPPNGSKASFSTSLTYGPNNWDKARDYYYKALTLTQKTDRDIFFSWAFQAVGQVMHLLQDMAVPAHVRNDFESHLSFSGKNSINPIKWWNNPFEYYVKNNPALVTDVTVTSSFVNTRLTDFWDTDQYNGSNPSTSTDIGLAEFTNANYLSDFTIPNNGTTSVHTFPYPYISSAPISGPSYQICPQQIAPGIVQKYVSRKINGQPCPAQTDVNAIDHFAATGLFFGYPDNNSVSYVWLDDNVHKQYAQELVPRAIGYSAGLLNYFFRGSIDMVLDPNGTGQYIIKNNSGETLSGTFGLYYNDTGDNRIPVPSASWTLTINANGQSLPLSFTKPTNPVTYMLVFNGQMGQEQGAVIGKMVDLLLLAPTPISPLEGQYIYGPYHDNGLVWNTISGGNGKYEISIDGGNSIVVVDTKYTDVLGLSQGPHTWKVRTQSSAGTAGPWSKTITFTKYNYLPAPDIVAPAIGSSVHDPVLDWSSISGAVSYVVNIFNIPNYTYTTVSSSYDTASLGLSAQIWYWMVKPIDSRGVAGYWSVPGHWTQTFALGVPSLSTPYNGSTTIASNPVLAWSAVSGANSYDVNIDGTTYNTANTSYTSSVGIGTHTWKVRARRTDGTVGSWSSSWSFTRANKYAAPSNMQVSLMQYGGCYYPQFTWNWTDGNHIFNINYAIALDLNYHYDVDYSGSAFAGNCFETEINGTLVWTVCPEDAYGNKGYCNIGPSIHVSCSWSQVFGMLICTKQ